jgi:hypothetical protein
MRAFSQPDTLSHFLNAVLADDATHQVTSVNNVELNSGATFARSIIFDVHCTLANGSRVVIEVQKADMRAQFLDRLVGYLGTAYSRQWLPSGVTEAGRGGYSLIPVRMVAVVDFALAGNDDVPGSLVANVSACVRAGQLPAASLARLRELLDITVVQLPLAPEGVGPDAPPAALWAHLLRFSERYTVDTLPPALAVEPYVSAAVSARVDAMTPAERASLEMEENHLRDTTRLLSDAAEEKRRADEATQRADEAKRRADEATQRLDEAKRRADDLESRLQALLRDGRALGSGGALGSAPPP